MSHHTSQDCATTRPQMNFESVISYTGANLIVWRFLVRWLILITTFMSSRITQKLSLWVCLGEIFLILVIDMFWRESQ